MTTHLAYSSARTGARLRQWWQLATYKRRSVGAMPAVKHRSFERLRAAVVSALDRPLAGARLLEVGCGQWLANVELFALHGARVTGIDPELPPAGPAGYLRLASQLGVERAAKTAATALLRPGFARRLRAQTDATPGFRHPPRLLRGVAEALPVDDASQDVVISDNVFEHLPDVEGAARELARVLRPGGIAVLVIHPITALSGGHHPGTFLHGDDPSWRPSIPPWAHLRADAAGHDAGVFLNRLRPSDYRTILTRHLALEAWQVLREGERFLTPEVAAALPGYDRDELTTGKLLAVLRRPYPTSSPSK